MPGVKLHSPGWEVRTAAAVRGTSRGGGPALAALPPEFLTAESSVAAEFEAEPRVARGAAEAGSLDFSYELAPGEAAILAVRHPSGALTFHLPRESTRRSRGGPVEVRFTVPIRSRPPTPETRGIASAAIKAVVVKVTGAVTDKVAALALPALARAFEAAVWKARGLKEGWLTVTKDTLAAGTLRAGVPRSTERSLLLIHGTFSNAAGAYKSLASSSFFESVASMYGDRIFAFDHFTISRTPEENARMLLEGLPDRSFAFDVVTHSRGGLVLRNLVERAAVFGAPASRFSLGRAVLVASPNEGTPLATPQRWEDTVGWIANLLELFPENPFTTGAEFVANALVWLARHASGDLPGLHSMDGDGELISTLQAPPGPPADRYSALVANYQPTDQVLQRLLDVGIDQFFSSANDLVVPAEGGWRVDRSGTSFIPGSRIGCFGPGGNLPSDSVTHVNFFSRAEAVTFLVRALAGEAQHIAPVDPAKPLPDRRLLRAGAAGVAAPAAAGARPAAARRSRMTGREVAPAPAEATLPPLAVTVVNCDLAFERLPLLVGHYRSTSLAGAEGVIDKLTGSAMSRSLALGVYPVEPGAHKVFLNTHTDPRRDWLTPRPEAVIVVGLGQEGSLQAAQLAYSVRQGVIAWVQRVAERSDTAKTVALAATLIGSGGTGITPGQAAQLIVQGVVEANELLAGDESGQPMPLVRRLRIVELYLDRASDAWRALKMQAAATPGRFEVVEPIESGTGALPRPLDSGYRGAEYDFVTAETRPEANGEFSIAYSLDTRRARTEVRAQTAQVRLLRHLVAQASSDQNLDPQIGRTLYKLLVPIELEPFLAGSGETQMQLDDITAAIPWELLDDGGEGNPDWQPWAIRAKLLRKFKTERFRERVTDADVEAPILVIGEPACPPEYQPLPGALAEARAVRACLSADGAIPADRVSALFADTPGRGPEARVVVNALFEKDWRIIHIAGHGALSGPDGGPGGVVLSNGTFLGPHEMKAMRIVPELVFVNCCHLGAMGAATALADEGGARPGAYDRARFASGVAKELIAIGVRCVVAAGWAVDDGAATEFATTFYKALLENDRFIDAVARARRAAFEFEGNTWAAYQCYGDPDWRLRRGGEETGRSRRPSEHEFDNVGSVTALKLALETLTVQSTFQGYDPPTQLERLRLLEKRWREMGWSASGGVGELFAQAFLAARDAREAIRWYDVAISASDGNVSFKALEQRSNLLIREAWRAVETARDDRDGATPSRAGTGRARRGKGKPVSRVTTRQRAQAERKLRAAIESARSVIRQETSLFATLSGFRATAERESLFGSAVKRLAMVEAAAGRAAEERKAIEAMARHYQEAMEISRRENPAELFYPAMNFLAAQLALHAGTRAWPRLDEALFQEIRRSLRAKDDGGSDFWSVAGEAELRLYQAVAEGRLARHQQGLLASYDDLAARVQGSQWGSVYDTAHFVLSKYAERASKAEGSAARTVLDRLKSLARPGSRT